MNRTDIAPAVFGPPSRLFRIQPSQRGHGYFVQTFDRFAGQWRLWGYERGRNVARTLVAVGIAAWVEAN